MSLRKQYLGILICLLFSLLLSSCSTLSGIMDSTLNLVGLGSENNLGKISVESTTNSNLQTPVAIDFVFVYDDPLGKFLITLTAPQWFQKKNALILQNGRKLIVTSTDLVPATPSRLIKLPASSKDAIAVLMFANYLSKSGQLAASLESFKKVQIKLDHQTYQINSGSN